MEIIKIPANVFYLQMKSPSVRMPLPEFEEGISISRWHANYKEYIALYKSVGLKWKWNNRLIINKEDVESIINNPQTELFVLKLKNQKIGFYELNHQNNETEIVYFGLADQFSGKGLGQQMMHHLLFKVWQRKSDRIWLHTCSLDSPKALNFYLQCGFELYDKKIEDQLIIAE